MGRVNYLKAKEYADSLSPDEIEYAYRALNVSGPQDAPFEYKREYVRMVKFQQHKIDFRPEADDSFSQLCESYRK